MSQKVQNIKYINTAEALNSMVDVLCTKEEIAFDTEFDRFHREYGFKLSLLQVFDGELCYIIDPLAIKDLSRLWIVFEDTSICKVAYSCSEDVQILKLNGCEPKNIYDVQIAAKLCNSPSNSFADILQEELGEVLDKSMQRSNWRTRPLSEQQLSYACSDVEHLMILKKLVHQKVVNNKTEDYLFEDNAACEQIPVTHFVVKLSAQHRQQFSREDQKKVYALLLLRDKIAQGYNIPPASVFTDVVAEKLMAISPAALPLKGMCSRLMGDNKNMTRIKELLELPVSSFAEIPPAEKKSPFLSRRSDLPVPKPDEQNLMLLKDAVAADYGSFTSDHILRGVKKALASSVGLISLKNYQINIVETYSSKLGITWEQFAAD